ncbi:GNAT family N-acetyltransferase [Thalassococcus sp. S3]|nr:GNAT family N-acetyltransferase [Thalassococcus sp. S3]
MKIRQTKSEDLPALKLVLDGTQLFPSEMLPDMIHGFLSDKDSKDIWLTCEKDGTPIGFTYTVPEQLTVGTWNMLSIAVLPSEQGSGVGGEIVKALEDQLRQLGHRILIVDTSGTDDFALTREFYRKNGYQQEACIRDFWDAGDDKIVFRKAL